MSVEGDNQYPVVGQVMGYEVKDKPAPTSPAPAPVIATTAVKHAQTEVDRALIGLLQLDMLDASGKAVMAQITPNMQLRRNHILEVKVNLERAMTRVTELIARLDDNLK